MESLESGMGLSLFDIGMPGRYDVGAREAAGVRALWKRQAVNCRAVAADRPARR